MSECVGAHQFVVTLPSTCPLLVHYGSPEFFKDVSVLPLRTCVTHRFLGQPRAQNCRRKSRPRLPNRPPSACARAPVQAGKNARAALPAEGSSDDIAYAESEKKFGFASLIGPSNSGKSTLLNRLVGSKVAIVTPKVQTTRCRIAGIVMYDQTQVAYLDTPGIFQTRGRLDRAMVKSAWGSGNEGDTVSIVFDVAEMYFVARKKGLEWPFVSDAIDIVLAGVAKKRKRGRIRQLCVLANKIDAIPLAERDAVVGKISNLLGDYDLGDDVAVFPISALHGEGIPDFTKWIVDRMPAGPWMYPDDDLTDMSARLIAAEVTREKLFMCLRNELPYEVAVETTSFTESQKNGSIRITQDILVRRDSQVRIVTGQGGAMVKKIGIAARSGTEGNSRRGSASDAESQGAPKMERRCASVRAMGTGL